MADRKIILSDQMIHSQINEEDELTLFLHLDNTGTEIPLDWHEEHADCMEMEIHFSFGHIIQELIGWHGFPVEEKKGIWFHRDQEKLVDLCKRDLQKCLDRLNKIQFLEEES